VKNFLTGEKKEARGGRASWGAFTARESPIRTRAMITSLPGHTRSDPCAWKCLGNRRKNPRTSRGASQSPNKVLDDRVVSPERRPSRASSEPAGISGNQRFVEQPQEVADVHSSRLRCRLPPTSLPDDRRGMPPNRHRYPENASRLTKVAQRIQGIPRDARTAGCP
jgi:hypothetical protein